MEYVTHKGIRCYGEFNWYDNVLVAGYYVGPNGEEMEEFEDIYCIDEYEKNWREVVATLSEWGQREGIKIVELSTC